MSPVIPVMILVPLIGAAVIGLTRGLARERIDIDNIAHFHLADIHFDR